ncbi:PQQ-dependent sugar dehydrogenase [Flavobacterium ustbae]|uniref:PQQ-dependent sugar dehydrogenase n=1 Tax=Flavobacterium ustbae TaxID=2488790 RepID=UPI000F772D6C|nr:PQQ-dependent sugar dehydrogenase [Flavobacterium ustbae]
MIIQKSIFLLVGMLALGSCSSNDNDDNTNVGPTGPPVENETPNTSYQPAFSGQTRAGSIQTTTEIESKVITNGLSAPWGIAYLPDGRLLITEKGGNMKIVTQAGVVGNAITGVPAVNPAEQGGLLGICLDPAFETNRMIYWTFSEVVAGGNITAVAKGRLSDNYAAIENATVIYRSNTPHQSAKHYGSRILFDKTGNLLVSIGERSDIDARPLAQSVTSSLGKIVRITTNGQAASGNPSFTQSGALAELYSIGHRNPQGLAIHPTTGELWQGEHGPRGGDEINRITPGANYGWPTITYGIEYGGAKIGEGITQQTGMEQPVYYWDPVVSPSGMTFYAGNRVKEWQNNLFIGALSGMHIVRLAIKDNKVAGEERLLASEGQRFRDIIQGKDEALYAVTDQGRLYKIDKK